MNITNSLSKRGKSPEMTFRKFQMFRTHTHARHFPLEKTRRKTKPDHSVICNFYVYDLRNYFFFLSDRPAPALNLKWIMSPSSTK